MPFWERLASAVHTISSNSQAIQEIMTIVKQFANEYQLQVDWKKMALGLGTYVLSEENKRGYINAPKIIPRTDKLYDRISYYAQIAKDAYDDKTREMMGEIVDGLTRQTGREKLEKYGIILNAQDDSTSEAPAHWIIQPYDNKEPLLLVVRGTANFSDVITDLHASTTKWPGPSNFGFVHQGMLQAAQVVKSKFAPSMWIKTDHGSEARKLVCVGHSLGGAVATYVCQLLREENFDVECYAFGSPPTFEKQAVSKVKGVYNVVHRDDIVPRICFMSLMDLMTKAMSKAGTEVDFNQFCGNDGVVHTMLHVPGLYITKIDDDLELVLKEDDPRKNTRIILSAICVTDHNVGNYCFKKRESEVPAGAAA